MLIGEVARRTGVPAGAIRFYERRKLVRAPMRSASGYRQYSERVIAEIDFIKRAQGIGLTLEQIREIASLGRKGKPCQRVVAICEQHIRDIDRRIDELRRLRGQLQETIGVARNGCGVTAEGFCRAIAARSPTRS
jgi:DNA-binding transcriptional MerR regulator